VGFILSAPGNETRDDSEFQLSLLTPPITEEREISWSLDKFKMKKSLPSSVPEANNTVSFIAFNSNSQFINQNNPG
jgi:hypothetical protein